VAWERWSVHRTAVLGFFSLYLSSPHPLVGCLITFNIVAWSRILFRSTGIYEAYGFVRAILLGQGGVSALPLLGMTVLSIAALSHYCPDHVGEVITQRFASCSLVLQGT